MMESIFMKFCKHVDESIFAKASTEDFFVKFRKNHPDFFEPSVEE